jgi:protein ImuB
MSADSSRRYLSVWLRRLATDRIECHSRMPDDAPRVVVQPVNSALRLCAVNDAAERLGLSAGMALADARAMHPHLAVVDADPEADARLLEAVADWCDRYTPLVGIDPPDGLVLDVTGCVHLFGGEVALAGDIVRRLGARGLQARIAIADTVGCAWAVAHYGTSSIVPLGGMRDALVPLPPSALRLAPGIADALGQSGIKRIADAVPMPRAALAARFGTNFVRRIDQALGREDEPITPRLPLPSYMVEQPFAEPIALERDVLGTLARLAGRLGTMLEQRGEGARVLQAALFRTDGKVYRIRLGTSAPLREAAAMTRLFADRLATAGDACDPGFGFDLVRLSALAAERCDPVQSGFATADKAVELTHLIDRLGARFGLRHVTVAVPQDTHIPEFAVAAVPAHAGALRSTLAPQPADDDSLAPARPIRLFDKPEPVEVIAEVPDGPPARFRWRHVLYEIAAAEGPERIAMEWWRDEQGRSLTRDYFRAESREGVRVWLFRDGLYGRETARPRWFVHGLFG